MNNVAKEFLQSIIKETNSIVENEKNQLQMNSLDTKELNFLIKESNQNWNISLLDRYDDKNKIVKIIKRIIYKGIKWCIEPFFFQQKSYNATMTRLTNELVKLIVEKDKKIEEMNNEIIKLNKIQSGFNNFDYVAFEERFRGDSKEIISRQSKYLKYLNGCQLLLDIGCGRGEFLSLVKAKGITAIGIDNNSEMVNHCKNIDLDVVCSDVFIYLSNSKEEFDVIFISQVIEHFTFSQLEELLTLCYEHLVTNGKIIIETPNKAALFHSFYIDPTHKRFIHPAFLEYYLTTFGFYIEEKQDFNYTGEHLEFDNLSEIELYNFKKINHYIFGPQDYAIIARKKE